jgi:transcriptional regulator GlxA family with amidase domain
VVFLAFEGLQPLDVTGPYEVFAGANQALGHDAYPLTIVAAAAGVVRAPSGLALVADQAFAPMPDVDTLIVPGGQGVHHARGDEQTLSWLRDTAAGARRVTSVCTGAFLLASAGLLGDGPVTTHWASADRLAREFPGLAVDPDPIYVCNGAVWTSAGVTAGIDLALALVEADHGADLAQQIARHLVMFLRRPGGQSQFATSVWSPATDPGPVRNAQDHIHDHVDDDLSIERLAALVGMSPRHFQREFRRQLGEPVGRYVDRVRVEAARRALEDDPSTNLAVIAARCGFGTAESLRRAFARRLGVSPDQYRRRFAVVA